MYIELDKNDKQVEVSHALKQRFHGDSESRLQLNNAV
jgi:hypothetical protein